MHVTIHDADGIIAAVTVRIEREPAKSPARGVVISLWSIEGPGVATGTPRDEVCQCEESSAQQEKTRNDAHHA